MSATQSQLWALQRGTFRFAVRLDEAPGCVPGNEVWWTPQHAFFCGLVSGSPRPVGVIDLSHLLNLPGAGLDDSSWVLTSGEDREAWALVSDVPPVPLEEPVESIPVPWLPTAMAREQVGEAARSQGEDYLIVQPSELTKVKISSSSFTVSEDRVQRRSARLAHAADRLDIKPALLATRIDTGWLALRSSAVQRVIETEHVSPLPGAMPVVLGLAAITGRVNMIVDPGRMLDNPPITPPCWIAQVKSGEARWGIAANNEWQVFTDVELEAIVDHTPMPGPEGMIVQRYFHGEDKVYVLSVEKLAEMAGGALEASHE